MGVGFSTQSSVKRSSTHENIIRVVHLNGYVEVVEAPATVRQLVGSGVANNKPPKLFVCTRAQLLSDGSECLKPNTRLEPGHTYFLLPFSAFQSGVSRLEVALLARKLTATAAKTNKGSDDGATTRSKNRSWRQQISSSRFDRLRVKQRSAQSWRPSLEALVETSS